MMNSDLLPWFIPEIFLIVVFSPSHFVWSLPTLFFVCFTEAAYLTELV
jgi:hypothetical protein